jgi:hypothetical protein
LSPALASPSTDYPGTLAPAWVFEGGCGQLHEADERPVHARDVGPYSEGIRVCPFEAIYVDGTVRVLEVEREDVIIDLNTY